MNYRELELMAVKGESDDATQVIDLDMKDPISQIQIAFEGLCAAPETVAGHPAKMITDITLKDGSDVLYNLSGPQAQAADFYHTNKEACNRLRYLSANYCWAVFNLNFGRWLWDKELALDPSNFSNLQLSISSDISAGGMSVSATRITVTGSLFDERKIEPKGFLTHKEHKSYAGGSATHERVSLPVDNAYRMMFFRCQRSGYQPDALYNTIKLEEDNGKKVPFDLTSLELIRHIQGRWKPYVENVLCTGSTTARAVHITPTYEPKFAGCQWVAAVNGYVSVYDGKGGRATTDSTVPGINVQFLVNGWLPHAVICFPFGDQKDLTDWYEMEKVESLVVDTLNESDGEDQTFEIFSQQLRRY